MQTVFNSIAALSLLGVVLLLFASSALLRIVRDLQAGLTDLQAATGPGQFGGMAAMTVAEFASPDDRPTYVVVVDAACPACHDRARDLTDVAVGYQGGHLAVLTTDPACEAWFPDGSVRVTVDSALLGRVGVGVTPTMLKYDPDGTELWRRVVGSQEDLHRLLDITPATQTQQVVPAA